jgi:predicted transcriptional regulator
VPHVDTGIMKKNENKKKCVLTFMVESNIKILNRHVAVLKTLQIKQPMGITELSDITGYPEHKVRYSLQILEQEGLIEPSIKGVVTAENVDEILKRIKNTIRNVRTAYNELLKKLG